MNDAAQLIRDLRERSGYTQAEVAARAGTSQPAIARYETGTSSPSINTLERIVRACGGRLVLSTDDAPQADLNSDLARLVRDNSSTIAAILRRHGFAHPRVFGSVARGTATPDSDIDLLVDSIDLPDLMRLIGAKHAIEDLLGVPVDLATPDLLKPDIKIAAEREAVPV